MRKEIVPNPGQPVLLDTRDVALILRRSEHQIRRDVHRGTVIPPFVVGGSRRWDLDELAAWISARCPRAEVWEQRAGHTVAGQAIETTDDPKAATAATVCQQLVPPAATAGSTEWGVDEIRRMGQARLPATSTTGSQSRPRPAGRGQPGKTPCFQNFVNKRRFT